jgi:hypothetical protein
MNPIEQAKNNFTHLLSTIPVLGKMFGGSQQPVATPQPLAARVTGWNPVSDGSGYLPAYDNAPAQYKYIPDPTPRAQNPVPQAVAPSQPVPPMTQTAVSGQNGLVNRGRLPVFDTQFKPNETVVDAINKAATKYNVPAQLLFDIGYSESSLDPNKLNPDAPALDPEGLFQFTKGSWYGGPDANGNWQPGILKQYATNPSMSLYNVLPSNNRQDPYTNALAAAYLIKYGQLGKWDASEWNWGNQWSPQELENLGFYKQTIYHNPGERASVRLSKKTNK